MKKDIYTKNMEVLKYALKEKDMTLEELAARVGVTTQTLRNYVSGYTPITVDKAYNINKCCGVGITYRDNYIVFENGR